MKTTLISSIIVASLLLYTCNMPSTENSKQETDTAVTHDEHEHESETIKLDNGKKWKVDENMMAHIRNMENDVNTFDTKKAEYAVLATKLSNNLDLLTANCTMTGQAHDELHKWLLPFIDLSEEFGESKNEKESVAYYQNIKTTFANFNTYFE